MKKRLLIRILCAEYQYTRSELKDMTHRELYRLYRDLEELSLFYKNFKIEML